MPYRELLREAEDQKRRHGDALQAPCDERRLSVLRGRVRGELGTELHEEYAGFLRLTDGMNWNGLYVYPSETSPVADRSANAMAGFVEANLGLREDGWCSDLLVFAEDSLDLFTRSVLTGEYRIYDRVPGNLIETGPPFDALMGVTLERCL